LTATAHPPVRVQELANFVGGERVPAASGQASDVTDPSTGEVYAQAPVSGPADVDAALTSAAAAQEGWRDATPAERSLALLRLADEALYRSKQAGRDTCTIADPQAPGFVVRRERDQEGAVVDMKQIAKSGVS